MGNISQIKRLKKYYKIFEQTYENSLMSIYNILQNIRISRNTVAKYLREIYTNDILHSPYICVKPSVAYKEDVYLMNFQDPWLTFNRLKGFPHVVYKAFSENVIKK